MDLTIRVLD